MDSVRMSIPRENGHVVMTTSDDQDAGQLIENAQKTSPMRSRSGRKMRQWPYEPKRRI